MKVESKNGIHVIFAKIKEIEVVRNTNALLLTLKIFLDFFTCPFVAGNDARNVSYTAFFQLRRLSHRKARRVVSIRQVELP